MKYLSDKYVSIYTYKGLDVCALKVAVPKDGDTLEYVIDSEMFSGQAFKNVTEAINAIDRQ